MTLKEVLGRTILGNTLQKLDDKGVNDASR